MIDNEFEAWLRKNKNLMQSSIEKYVRAVSTISKDLGKELGIDLKIYDISDMNEFNKIYKSYYDNSELMNKNKKGNNMYSNGLNCYKEFLEDKQNINVKPVAKVVKVGKALINSSPEISKQIQKYIISKGFIYNDKDLNNFYLSLRTKPFVILAGISGSGKSKLVRLFAEAIGATKENGRFNMISVKPDWNDSTELLGYKNINEEFVPGKLTKIIYEASKSENKDMPYFICLDEMNLARVEYYLSDYLSLIE
ncbi:AAA family ATPase, partial [Clostridium sp.]